MDMDAIIERQDAFAGLLAACCDRETSADPDGWTAENPLWGHCAVAALSAQDRFGGTLRRASLEKFPKFAHMRSHYWNRFLYGGERDFTRPQFGDDPPQGLVAEERTRAYVLSHAPTLERYKLLSWRLAVQENPGVSLFWNDAYRRCYTAAMASSCQKMRFGSVLMHQGQPVAETCNATIDALKDFCEPTCVRLSITSRTESMIGACGHAEEHALWYAAKKGIRTTECDLYVAGVRMNGSPWLKDRPEHTCLRCASQMHMAGIRRIFVPTAAGWASVTTAEACRQAKDYAVGAKSV